MGCCTKMQQPAMGCFFQNLAKVRSQAARKHSEYRNQLTLNCRRQADACSTDSG